MSMGCQLDMDTQSLLFKARHVIFATQDKLFEKHVDFHTINKGTLLPKR
jgi:hypothetical protein